MKGGGAGGLAVWVDWNMPQLVVMREAGRGGSGNRIGV